MVVVVGLRVKLVKVGLSFDCKDMCIMSSPKRATDQEVSFHTGWLSVDSIPSRCVSFAKADSSPAVRLTVRVNKTS